MKKKYIIQLIALLLSLTASAERWQGTVALTLTNAGGFSLSKYAVATFDDATRIVTLGNGYNACISHYEEGSIFIPGTYEKGGITYTVEIGSMAFRFCNRLTAVTVGEGVTKIGSYAFVGCASMTTVSLPATLTSIGSGAFTELASLKTMICYAPTSPEWEWNDVFAALGTKASMAKMASERTLYVTGSAYNAYKDYLFEGTWTNAGERVGWQHAFRYIYGFSSEPVSISSAEELVAFRDSVNNGEAYKNNPDHSVILTADIDLSSVGGWIPIGTLDHPFGGTFNGDGHIIKGLNATTATNNNGLFGVTDGANIYHFHLLNPVISNAIFGGTVVGTSNNTRISDVLVTSDASSPDFTLRAELNAGGIVGASNASTTIERCLFRGRIMGVSSAGGIVGSGVQGLTITDCSADNYIENVSGASRVAGGIVGLTSQASITRCIARNEFANATVKGAIIGMLYNTGTPTTLTTDISSCTYWKNPTSLNLVGSKGSGTEYTETSWNLGYEEETGMVDNTTSIVLGDGWHYFRKEDSYYDYPVPETLTDMYLWGTKYESDANGLVYAPVETSSGVESYQVVGYTGTAEALTIPDHFKELPVIAVAADVFNGNTTIKTMTFGENMLMIGDRAFYGSAIETLNFGENVKSIGKSAFEDCDGLQEVELPDLLHSLGARAFCGCDNLTSFGIGYYFAEHDGNFLAYCHKLNHLYIRGNREKSYNNFYCLDNVLIHQYEGTYTTYFVACAPGKTGNYTLPTQIDEVTDTYYRINVLGECFEGCTGLTGITFPVGKSYWVGGRAFSGATNLRYIDMSSITEIHNGEGYERVYYDVDRQNEEDPFYGTSNSTIIYLPEGHSAEADEPNIVIGGTANSLMLTDGWDFTPLVDITATNGVTYDRTFTASRIEVTQSTGNKIVVTDEETGETKEIDELEVTGYDFPPTGYSVCLPYNLTVTDDNIKVYEPEVITPSTENADQYLNVSFSEVVNKEMEANKPYYITISGDDKYDLNSTVTTFIPRPSATTPWQSQNIEFKGTTTNISNADLSSDNSKPAYILQDDGNWHRVAANTDEAYVPTFRAYFQATEATTADVLVTVLPISIELANASDNSDVIRANLNKVCNVTLRDRKLYKDGSWNTLCLPFDATLADSPLSGDNVEAKKLVNTSFSDGKLTLNFEDCSTIPAGTPFIIKWDEEVDDITNPVFENVAIRCVDPDLSTTSHITFCGTFSPVGIYEATEKHNLYLGADNKLYYPTSDFTVNACRGYFRLNGDLTVGDGDSNSVKAFVLNFGDDNDPTDLNNLRDFNDLKDNWFDLSGRRLSGKPSQKGIFIRNGRKEIFK